MSLMSWFSNLFTNETINLAVAEGKGQVRDPYQSVRTMISDGTLRRQIYVLIKLVLKIPTSPRNSSAAIRQARAKGRSSRYGIDEHWPHRSRLVQLLNSLGNLVMDIDLQRADLKTLLKVIDVCNDVLPAILRELEIKMEQAKVGKITWEVEESLIKKMETVISEILDEIAVLPTNRSIMNIEVSPSEGADNNEFPNIEPYRSDEELYELLNNLKSDWDKATSLPLSSEDEYVIERVGNSYLPDALLLFDRFSRRTGAGNNTKAMQIVTEQVRLIHQQVKFVLEQNEEDSLDLMETHTAFLKMKNSRLGVPEEEGFTIAKSEEEPVSIELPPIDNLLENEKQM